MTTQKASADHRPVGLGRMWFGLFGGPLAWSLEAMTAWALVAIPCAQEGSSEEQAAYRAAAIVVCALGVLVALAALRVAWKSLAEAPHAQGGDAMVRAARSRARFMAKSGVSVSALFVVATALTAAGPIVFPPCT
jgi:hypothetical protein